MGFKQGQKLRIVSATQGHGFSIGEEVEVEINEMLVIPEGWALAYNGHDRWYVSGEEVELCVTEEE